MNSKGKVVILGASGLMGKEIVHTLTQKRVPFVAIDKEIDQALAEKNPDQWVSGSADNVTLLDHVIEEGDDVFHFAEGGYPGVQNEFDVGMASVVRLDNICKICSQKRSRLIYPSSGGTVYGQTESEQIKETHPMNPISTYGFFKKTNESLITYHASSDSLEFIIMRVANCYNGNLNHAKKQGIINVSIQSITSGDPINLYDSGKQVRDFIHTRDIADLCLKIHSSDTCNKIINVGTGRGSSIMKIIELVSSSLGKKPVIHNHPKRQCDVATNILDCRKAEELFGWSAKISIEKGIEEACQNNKA